MEHSFKKAALEVARAGAFVAGLSGVGNPEVVRAEPTVEEESSQEAVATPEARQEEFFVAEAQVKPHIHALAEIAQAVPVGVIDGAVDITPELRDQILTSIGETQALIDRLATSSADILTRDGDGEAFQQAAYLTRSLREAQRAIHAALTKQPIADYAISTPGANAASAISALEANLTTGRGDATPSP